MVTIRIPRVLWSWINFILASTHIIITCCYIIVIYLWFYFSKLQWSVFVCETSDCGLLPFSFSPVVTTNNYKKLYFIFGLMAYCYTIISELMRLWRIVTETRSLPVNSNPPSKQNSFREVHAEKWTKFHCHSWLEVKGYLIWCFCDMPSLAMCTLLHVTRTQ
jgi:hypothetical protein